MKSKVWIFYLIMNLALVGVAGYFGYKAFFPPVVTYPAPVTVFQEELPYGEKLKIVDPFITDNDDNDSTYTFTLTNSEEEPKSFYLYLEVSGDDELLDCVTIKARETGLLINYQPNAPFKKIDLQPGASTTLTLKVYIDLMQVLDSTIFSGKSITIKFIDDQAAFYGISREGENSDQKPTNDQEDQLPPVDDQDKDLE